MPSRGERIIRDELMGTHLDRHSMNQGTIKKMLEGERRLEHQMKLGKQGKLPAATKNKDEHSDF